MFVVFKLFLVTFITFIPAISHSQNSIPEYLERISRRCSIVWEFEGVIQSKMICRQGAEAITESKEGTVTIRLKRDGRIVGAKNEVMHIEAAPEPINDFIAWAQSCKQSGSCKIQDDMNGVFDTIGLINLDEGVWEFQLSSAKEEPDRGSSTFFFLAGKDIFAIRNTANNFGSESSIKIFPFFIVEDVN
ncbi:hypothetical protein [Ruegeria atlantica]|uniref:hypothetical protein n=1 Tax=Ruegeria atlantica TaxID=81569 RepID=UPI00147F7042|nr:hypothetical protein [Ruegeria atlantica]